MQEIPVRFLGREDTLEKGKATHSSSLGLACGSDGKESACNVEDPGSIPGLGRSLGGGHGNPLQYACLENPHGQRSLAGYRPWGNKESDTTECLSTQHSESKSKPTLGKLLQWGAWFDGWVKTPELQASNPGVQRGGTRAEPMPPDAQTQVTSPPPGGTPLSHLSNQGWFSRAKTDKPNSTGPWGKAGQPSVCQDFTKAVFLSTHLVCAVCTILAPLTAHPELCYVLPTPESV